jgi:hypothetical protein
MKKNVLKIVLFLFSAAILFSCKDENKEMVNNKIAALEKYVDSVKAVNVDDAEENWDRISADFDSKVAELDEATKDLSEDAKREFAVKVDAAKSNYDQFKTSVDESIAKRKAEMNNPNFMLRSKFFGQGKVGEDLNFSWVNKDNILSAYEGFLQAYKDNKSSFAREDYDYVKMMYEALDARKNTVENEGLSSDDNGKIAKIKLEFAPMFKLNRIGAKSRENAAAKE